ncbi:MAG: hypothetical protein QXD89_02800 [Candidatus Aenigmatarchaeota archaeon]
MKILIGTPVNKRFTKEVKNYIKCIKNLKNKKHKIKVCFATEDERLVPFLYKFSKNYKILAKVITFDDKKIKILNISKAREVIRKYFISSGFDLLFFLDSDISIDKEGLEKMVEMSGKFDLIINAYPEANPNIKTLVVSGLGCSLIKKKILEKIKFEESVHPEDILFFQKVVTNRVKYINGIFGKVTHKGKKVDRNKLNLWEKLKFKIFVIFCILRLVKLYNFAISKLKIRQIIKI